MSEYTREYPTASYIIAEGSTQSITDNTAESITRDNIQTIVHSIAEDLENERSILLIALIQYANCENRPAVEQKREHFQECRPEGMGATIL